MKFKKNIYEVFNIIELIIDDFYKRQEKLLDKWYEENYFKNWIDVKNIVLEKDKN